MENGGVIDITEFIELLRSTFVLAATSFIKAYITTTPFAWLTTLPIISTLFSKALNWIMNTLSTAAFMQTFFLNTAIRKNGQANDFINAIKLKDELPKDVSDEVYARYERNQIIAFNSLVRLDT